MCLLAICTSSLEESLSLLPVVRLSCLWFCCRVVIVHNFKKILPRWRHLLGLSTLYCSHASRQEEPQDGVCFPQAHPQPRKEEREEVGGGEEGAGAKLEDKNIFLRQLTGRERENYFFWKSLLSQVTHPTRGTKFHQRLALITCPRPFSPFTRRGGVGVLSPPP